jgi:RHS repeat-associated protein
MIHSSPVSLIASLKSRLSLPSNLRAAGISSSNTRELSLVRFAVCLWLGATTVAASGQLSPTMGAAPFQLRDTHKYDSINLYDLGVAVDIPVIDKPGLMPFKYDLVQESDAGIPLTGVYSQQTSVINSGYYTYFGGSPPELIGLTPISSILLVGNCVGQQTLSLSLSGTPTYTSYFTIVDSSGAQHIVWAQGSTLSNAIPFDVCAPSGGSATATGITLDWSGYTTTVTVNLATKVVSYTLYDTLHGFTTQNPNGNLYFTGTGPWSNTITITDANNNSVKETTTYPSAGGPGSQRTTTWTDATNSTVLTVTSSYWTQSCQSNCPWGYYPTSYTYYDANNNPQTYTVSYNLWAWAQGGLASNPTVTTPLPSQVLMPDRSAFQFNYQNLTNNTFTNGYITSMSTPLGENITYYEGLSRGYGNNYELQRTGADGTWVYTLDGPTMVHSPKGDTSYYYWWQANSAADLSYTGPPPPIPIVSLNVPTNKLLYAGEEYTGQGTLLSSQTFCYNSYFHNGQCGAPVSSQGCGVYYVGGNPTGDYYYCYPVITQDIYSYVPGKSSPSLLATTYDGVYERELEAKAYDFGATIPPSGSPITDTVYQWGAYNSGNGTCSAVSSSINDRVCTVQVKDGSGAIYTQTNNTYDTHGNQLSTSQLVSGSTYLTTSHAYNTNGTLKTSTDVNGTVATTTNNACNNTLPTNVLSGGLSVSLTWNCNTGGLTSVTDANGAVTQFSYSDPLWRLSSVTDALLNITSYSYGQGGSYVEASLPFNSGLSVLDTRNTMDTVGRIHVSQASQGPSGGSYDTTTYTYDSDGRLSFTSLPCVVTSWGAPCGGSSGALYSYDALNRATSASNTAQPTPGQVGMSYVQNDVLTALNPAPPGENAKQRQTEYDGLGRLSSICELTSVANGGGVCGQSTSQTGFWTRYRYDAAGRLIGVCQDTTQPLSVDCIQSPSAGQQTRTYTYDGLGRLTSETNPELGTTQYLWDAAPPICWNNVGWPTPGDLGARLDNAGNYICYGYDSLHRLSGGLTRPSGPCFGFVYDSATPPSGSGIVVQNTAGRMVEAYTNNDCAGTTHVVTDEWFGYSARGESTDVYELTPNSSGYYHTTASYWANGTLSVLSGVPGLSGWTFGPDGEGRPYSATYGSSAQWVKSATYYPSSPQTTITYGSGTTDTDVYSYDLNTGQMKSFQFTVGSAKTTLTGTLGLNPNGTLGTLGIVDQFNSTNSQNCSYTYDDLARLAGLDSKGYTIDCGSGGWQQTITLDPFGNISKSGSSSFAASYKLSNGTTNNQEQMVSNCAPQYDGRGNLIKDCSFPTPHTYTWDTYGNPSSLNGVSVTYDALGREVQIGTSAEVLYSPIGKLGLMKGQTAKTIRIPLPGGSTAELEDATGTVTHILHSDWLGSSRLSTTYLNRGLAYDTAYAPYGENYAAAGSSSTDLDFTGEFQDTTAGLYDFEDREYSPVQGRWISPDPAGLGAADTANPQSWNRYAYVKNNPLGGTDPNGEDDSGDSNSCDGFDACIDFSWSGDTGTITSTTYTSNGSLGSSTYNPWGNSMAFGVFTKNPILPQADRTMQVVTGIYAGGYAIAGGFVVGGALGLGTAARGLYLIYGAPFVTSMACAELCSGMSPWGSAPATSALAEAAESGGAPEVAVLGNKLDYILGKGTGLQHNIDRSESLLAQIRRIGLYDSPSTREYLREQLNQVLNNPSNVLKIQENGRRVRESLLMGPQGAVKLETIWEGNKLITVKIYGGG